MSAEPLVYEALSDAELGVMSEAGSSSMHSHPSVSPPKALTSRQIAPARSQTAPLPLLPFEFTRPSTTAPTALPPFDEHALPTQNQLIDAAAYTVIAENGLRVPFGDLFRQQKVIVIFIRHFWCPLCQDYMFSISDNADPKVLERAGVNLVIISNGSYNMIKSYRQIFRTPFAVYTDPTLRVYTALGMTLRPAEQSTEPYRRGYVKHGPVSGIKMIVLNALRVGMPVWEKGGDPAQLGGEFVLGPGMTATYAHRMRTTRSHSPITGVLAAAGIDLCTRAEPPATRRETIGPLSVIGSEADEEQWMEERRLSLARLKEKKMARRLGVKLLPLCPGPESDTELSGAGRRRSTMMSRTESSIAEEQEEEEHPLPAVPDSDTTISPSSETAENGDTDRDSVETQTVADSDGESDRTRADEDDMQLARDYNKVEKLSFEGHPVSRPVITSVSVV
ncbi:hypothetical protein BJ138DRAFT_1001522 [Hygrophoropsis aurantiaca]|uniref:Uncharacterized protein n=1 Tax=Hygrophoropsis aurantiaca TaxID=72124 RepID=A0ACB8AMM5_9AGAM|nr:hypothetical protein BJ138DRAFT_1001522 [Hygrophoropsis aurantiaca]